tara:strand:+ start:1775 stop:2764 length:990 start_codon:yes stop_codon:yes gene_type:complete
MDQQSFTKTKFIILLLILLLIAGAGLHYFFQISSSDFRDSSYVSPLDQTLPPDPGEEGELTLEGIDSDNDGLRDDVQRWIAINFPDLPLTRAALRDLAITEQELVLNYSNEEAAKASLQRHINAAFCLSYVDENSTQLIGYLRSVVVNTEDRLIAWYTSDEITSGEMYSIPKYDEWKDSCSFDPEDLDTNVPGQEPTSDPVEEGGSTLIGTDSDHDGVRDDIEKWIEQEFPDDTEVQNGLRQFAQATQQALVDAESEELSLQNHDEIDRARNCLYALMGLDDSYTNITKLLAEILNTRERSLAYIKYDEQLAGKFFSLTYSNSVETCDS